MNVRQDARRRQRLRGRVTLARSIGTGVPWPGTSATVTSEWVLTASFLPCLPRPPTSACACSTLTALRRKMCGNGIRCVAQVRSRARHRSMAAGRRAHRDPCRALHRGPLENRGASRALAWAWECPAATGGGPRRPRLPARRRRRSRASLSGPEARAPSSVCPRERWCWTGPRSAWWQLPRHRRLHGQPPRRRLRGHARGGARLHQVGPQVEHHPSSRRGQL